MSRTLLKEIAVCIAIATSVGGLAQMSAAQTTQKSERRDWPVYGGAPENTHYSAPAQMNRQNVKQLQVAWAFETGESGGLQTSPIIVGRVLYAYSPSQKVIALDAATGNLLWKFDPAVEGWQPSRGLAYWTDGKERRILAGVMNLVYALDADNGKPISTCGEKGHIDLRKDLGRDPETQSIALTSPGLSTRTYSLLAVATRRRCPPLPAISVPTMSAPAHWRGRSIPSRIPAEGGNRRKNLAFPGGPARPLGPRLPISAYFGHGAPRRKGS